MPVPAMPVPQQAAVTPESVTALGDPAAQKQFLGEHLYPKVATIDQERAGRIVGMILDAYNTEQICENLSNDATLKVTVDRATETLREHESAQPAGEPAQ